MPTDVQAHQHQIWCWSWMAKGLEDCINQLAGLEKMGLAPDAATLKNLVREQQALAALVERLQSRPAPV